MQHEPMPPETGFFANLFKADFVPRVQCYRMDATVTWVHFVSDMIITLAYFSIPIALAVLVIRRKDLAFNWMFMLFGGFILLCGTTHLFNILALEHPMYRLDGMVKALTAGFSIGTAVALWPLIPKIVALPSSEQLRQANSSLGLEITERRAAQAELEKAKAELERRVQERTAELATINAQLRGEIEERRAAAEQVRRLNATLEVRVRERTAALEQANSELEAYSYSVSHDLRAPLRHLSGFASLLQAKRDSLSPEELGRLTGQISSAAARAGQLVDDLLAFSRMGRAEVRRVRAPMQGIVKEVLEELREEVAQDNVRWTIEELPTIDGDPSMLRVVWKNILSNAIKYTRPRERAEARVWAEEAEVGGMRGVWFNVQDNGVGFDMAYVGRLFEVFQRLHESTEFEGTGIGLATVRRVIERHGGKVEAKGEVDKGATVRFFLPRREDKQS